MTIVHYAAGLSRTIASHWCLVGLVAAAALPAAYTLDPCLDADTWWHMATGRWIVQHREVPWIDPFSQMSHDTPTRWYAYSWLYEIYLFKAFDLGSYRGIMAVRTLSTAASTAIIFAFLVYRRGSTPLTLILALLLGMVLMMFAKERPWHFTIAFTTITLWAVQAVREGWPIWKISWLPILFTIWANLHIQFVLGWLVVGIACLFPGMAKRNHFIILFLACLAATAINPYHIHLVEVIIEYATQTAPMELVQELAPPDYGDPSTWATLVLLTIGFAFALPRRDGFAIVLLIIAAIFAMRMRRDIWFAAVAVIATMPAKSVEFRHSKLFAYTAFAICLTFMAIRGLNNLGVGPRHDFEQANEHRDPSDAAHLLSMHMMHCKRPPEEFHWTRNDAIFNTFDWGGYLIWLDLKVSIDGRTNLYGDERLRRSIMTWNRQGDWEHDPCFLKARLIIAPANKKLTDYLLETPRDWLVIQRDENLIIFGRLH